MVDAARPQLAVSANSKRTGSDGKQYPATRTPPTEEREEYDQETNVKQAFEFVVFPSEGGAKMGMN